MSNKVDLGKIDFYASQNHPCSYLQDRTAQTLYVDPSLALSPEHYDQLIAHGFRRSGKHLYRPHCSECDACWSTRVIVDDYLPGRSDRRIIKKNSDLETIIRDASFNEEHYELYCRYQNARHQGGGMDESSRDDYVN